MGEGYATIERQRGVVRGFKDRNQIKAEVLLRQFAQSQAAHIAHRRRLLDELAKTSNHPKP